MSHHSYLLNKPVNLMKSPLFLVYGVIIYIFSHMRDRIIQLSADHAVAYSAATFIEDNVAAVCFLSVHHKTYHNSKLTM